MNIVLYVLGYLATGTGLLLVMDTILISMIRRGDTILKLVEDGSTDPDVSDEDRADLVKTVKEIHELREKIMVPKKMLWMVLTWPSLFIIYCLNMLKQV